MLVLHTASIIQPGSYHSVESYFENFLPSIYKKAVVDKVHMHGVLKNLLLQHYDPTCLVPHPIMDIREIVSFILASHIYCSSPASQK